MRDKDAIHIKGNGIKTYGFGVVIESDGDRYDTETPTLPGGHSSGYTGEEALKNIQEAAPLCLETMTRAGEPIPEQGNNRLSGYAR